MGDSDGSQAKYRVQVDDLQAGRKPRDYRGHMTHNAIVLGIGLSLCLATYRLNSNIRPAGVFSLQGRRTATNRVLRVGLAAQRGREDRDWSKAFGSAPKSLADSAGRKSVAVSSLREARRRRGLIGSSVLL